MWCRAEMIAHPQSVNNSVAFCHRTIWKAPGHDAEPAMVRCPDRSFPRRPRPLPELKPVKKSRSLLAAALLLFVANDTLAQQGLVSDPEIYEKKFFQGKCKVVQFDSGFVTRKDINNDGLVDAVVNHGAVVCDGERGVGCNGDGCLYNLYLQVKEGGYFMIATARLYSLDYEVRYGNNHIAMKMHPRFCDRAEGEEPCLIVSRVRGTTLYTVQKK